MYPPAKCGKTTNMEILKYPDEKLRIKTKSITEVTPELLITATEMYKVMREARGIGLAAPQVGLDISLIVLEDSGSPLILFNPIILHRSKDLEYAAESCLSFPDVYRIIKRPLEVTVKYRSEHNKMKYAVLKGIQARCIIHEVDHLMGRLFIDLEEKKETIKL